VNGAPPPSPEASLVRAIGVRQLAAGIVNVTVGAGIFVLPAAVAAGLGAAAPAAYLVCAAAMALVVTSFALAGSRVSLTGGIYAYVEVAFGPYVGFLAGVLQWLMLWLTAAGLLSAFVDQVGLLVPGAGQGLPRAGIILATVGLLAFVNVRGVAIGARVIEGAVVAKLLPLAVFLAVGVFFIQPSALAWPGWPEGGTLGEAVLLLIFAFVGIEVALVPSGEVRDPHRTVPRAIYLALGVTTLLYLAIQAVAQGVLGAEMAGHAEAPLAAAASRFLGEGGRLLVLAGGAVSMFGYLCGDMLSSPRSLYAFGRDGFLPGALARVHPRFHTPHVAIAAHAFLAAALAISSTFQHLAILSNVSVLTLYFLC
jgi:APA family basic amino acid/polyamine antiporter